MLPEVPEDRINVSEIRAVNSKSEGADLLGMSLTRQPVPGNATLAIQDDLVSLASRDRMVRPRGTLAGVVRTDAQVWMAVCKVNR